MSEISSTWFEEAKKLSVGQSIFIRVANKAEQIRLAKAFEEERENYAKIETVHASQLFINKTLMERKQYVVIERKYRAPFTAFFRDKDGSFSKLTVDPDRRRTIVLMVKDGRDRKEIEETLNGLTEDELTEFFNENQTTS
jgi:hypothetical protein